MELRRECRFPLAIARDDALHAVRMPGARDSLATDCTIGEEGETVVLVRAG